MAAARAVDNDVLLKAIQYGLEDYFWLEKDFGILGAAPYVVGGRLKKEHDPESKLEKLDELIAEVEDLEPDAGELELAAEIERRAGDLNLELDGGESQLAAIAIRRGIAVFETGDKRAIAGLERMADEIDELVALGGRVRCLEQIAHRISSDEAAFPVIAAAICARPATDRSLSTCFSCYSGGGASQKQVLEALESYIGSLRQAAQRMLEAGP
jgi:hypothetical protein